ncbi:segregation/condensation protein A [Bdellovibrionota bacterium FG-2]
MAYRVPITVRLDHFEGPLDLLLYLIQSREMDVSNISIAEITDQYLAYVRLIQELNFDIASEFLVMAATLLHWKSKALLPQDDANLADGADGDAPLSPEELIRQLLEHQRFLAMGDDLAQRQLLGIDVFTRPNPKPTIERVWRDMSISDLALSYQEILIRSRKRVTILKKETISLTDKIREMRDHLKVGELTELRRLVAATGHRDETVVTFLASLELARLKKMKLYQEGTYQPIYVELLELIKDLDFHMASGFDNPAPSSQSMMEQTQ